MGERKTRSNRHLQPSHSKKSNGLLNVLIGVVVVLIAVTGMYVFKWQDHVKDRAQEETPVTEQEETEDEPSKEDIVEEEEPEQEPRQDDQQLEQQQPEQETALEAPSDDPIVDRVITDESWQPTPTTQAGAHVSSYDDKSVDWAEKVATITAVTGIEEGNMIIWRLGNNGGANKAIGTVSTKDKKEMYRVSMEWIDQQGWLPVKLEQLNTIEGAY